MLVFDSLEAIKDSEPAAVALGNFDGVHLGHQKLIRKMVSYAKERGLKAAVFTFSNHPKNLLPNAKPVKNILYRHEKEEIMASLGVDILKNVYGGGNAVEVTGDSYVIIGKERVVTP